MSISPWPERCECSTVAYVWEMNPNKAPIMRRIVLFCERPFDHEGEQHEAVLPPDAGDDAGKRYSFLASTFRVSP